MASSCTRPGPIIGAAFGGLVLGTLIGALLLPFLRSRLFNHPARWHHSSTSSIPAPRSHPRKFSVTSILPSHSRPQSSTATVASCVDEKASTGFQELERASSGDGSFDFDRSKYRSPLGLKQSSYLPQRAASSPRPSEVLDVKVQRSINVSGRSSTVFTRSSSISSSSTNSDASSTMMSEAEMPHEHYPDSLEHSRPMVIIPTMPHLDPSDSPRSIATSASIYSTGTAATGLHNYVEGTTTSTSSRRSSVSFGGFLDQSAIPVLPPVLPALAHITDTSKSLGSLSSSSSNSIPSTQSHSFKPKGPRLPLGQTPPTISLATQTSASKRKSKRLSQASRRSTKLAALTEESVPDVPRLCECDGVEDDNQTAKS